MAHQEICRMIYLRENIPALTKVRRTAEVGGAGGEETEWRARTRDREGVVDMYI